MASLSDFNQLIRTYLPGAPDPTIEFAVRRAARRFCSLSWFARRSITVTLVSGTAVYTLSPTSAQEEIVGVHAIEFDDEPLDPTKPELVNTTSGTPKRWYFEPESTITLDPTPDDGVDGEVITVRIATQPTRTTETIADDIVREYEQCIADGAIAWIMAMPKQPWSDKEGAAMMERKFMSQTMRAKESAMRGHMPWGFSVRRPVFAVR